MDWCLSGPEQEQEGAVEGDQGWEAPRQRQQCRKVGLNHSGLQGHEIRQNQSRARCRAGGKTPVKAEATAQPSHKSPWGDTYGALLGIKMCEEQEQRRARRKTTKDSHGVLVVVVEVRQWKGQVGLLVDCSTAVDLNDCAAAAAGEPFVPTLSRTSSVREERPFPPSSLVETDSQGT